MDLGAASFQYVRCLASTALQCQRSYAVARRALRSATKSGKRCYRAFTPTQTAKTLAERSVGLQFLVDKRFAAGASKIELSLKAQARCQGEAAPHRVL